MSSVMKDAAVLAGHVPGRVSRTTYCGPRWLPGCHLQTIYAYCLPRPSSIRFRRERWETPDGDFIDLDWLDCSGSGTELVVLFHGLEGGSRSHYALSLASELRRQSRCGVVVHFRGCGGEINRLARSYHAGDSAEIDWILRRLKKENPHSQLHAVGISMGGNDLLKWAGEQGDGAAEIVRKAVAASAPVDLKTAAQQLDCGWNKLLYTRDFLRTMKRKVLKKIPAHDLRLDPRLIRASSTFREFDNLYTAPMHGFTDADDYWARSSSKPWLKRIRVPTLIINARNDPFFPGDALPKRQEVANAVRLEYTETGGHVGFVSGRFPGHLEWLPRRILDFFFEPAF